MLTMIQLILWACILPFANGIDIVRIDLKYDSYANEFSLGKSVYLLPEFTTTNVTERRL